MAVDRELTARRAAVLFPPHESYYYLELLRRAGWIAGLPEMAPIRLEGIAQAAAMEGRALYRRSGLPLPVLGVSPGRGLRGRQEVAARPLWRRRGRRRSQPGAAAA